jgi:hypothetical protein
MKLLIAMVFGFATASSYAHEIGSQDRKNLNWLAQMAGSHAIKICSDRPEFASCRKQQIRALLETAATVPGLAGIPPMEFVALVERQALASNYATWQTSAALNANAVDCRIDVC